MSKPLTPEPNARIDADRNHSAPSRPAVPPSVTLTESERLALLDVLVEYMQLPLAVSVFIDVARDVETTPRQLLARLLRHDEKCTRCGLPFLVGRGRLVQTIDGHRHEVCP